MNSNDNMIDNYSERIKFARSLTKLSREAFQEKYGINKNTLKSWELGINTLPEKSATQIADAIKNEGFSCSPEWLIFGIGTEPKSSSLDNSLLDALSEQSRIIQESEYFKKNNSNAISMMVTDHSMVPNFEVGDYIGGILEEKKDTLEKLQKFLGNNCIISLQNNIYLIRKLFTSKDGLIILCPLNANYCADIITIKDIRSIAIVIWHRVTNRI